ncbi:MULTISPECIES: hypothetical protein [Paenibacillus]|uniref:DUF4367 domain-containing protein n=3 Tax=Paenibacillus validus TaxID=44253 RepID=A0A7X2Z6B8_9BACL|nr:MULTISPECIES: hypothetical protein [Paenibacillus]MUG69077.1 hypothetical protein [Paenibacillus validus]
MTNRLTNKMVRRAALAAAALLTAGTLLAACQKSEKKPEDNAQTAPAPATGGEQQPGSAGQTPPAGQGGTGTAPGGTAAQPNEPVKLTPLSYLEEEKKFIRETANKLGVKTVYLPQQGAPDDRLSQVQGMEKAFALVFLKMQIVESAQEIKPADKPESEREVKLNIGTGKWVTVAGQPTLYLKLGDTYLALSSAKSVSPQEIEAIAETLAPMK